jgi:hypothetical protein
MKHAACKWYGLVSIHVYIYTSGHFLTKKIPTLLGDESAVTSQGLGLLEPLVAGQLVVLAALGAVPAATRMPSAVSGLP